MSTPATERWPLLTRLEPEVIADSLTGPDTTALPVGFTTDDPNRLGAILLKPGSLYRGEGLGQFVVSGQTQPQGYDVVITIDPFRPDGTLGIVELTPRVTE